MGKRILLIDDDELVLDSFRLIFADLGFEVTVCDDGTQAVDLVKSQLPDLVLSDIRMPGMNGSEVVRAIKGAQPNARVFVLTAFPGDPLVQVALEAGAEGVMRKPFDIAKILDLMSV